MYCKALIRIERCPIFVCPVWGPIGHQSFPSNYISVFVNKVGEQSAKKADRKWKVQWASVTGMDRIMTITRLLYHSWLIMLWCHGLVLSGGVWHGYQPARKWRQPVIWWGGDRWGHELGVDFRELHPQECGKHLHFYVNLYSLFLT